MCLCLVLNGAGSAAAAVRMQATGMMGQTHASHVVGDAIAGHAIPASVAAKQADAGTPCHDMDSATAADHGKTPTNPEAGTTSQMPDCCKAGACQCVCAQYVPVVIAFGLPGGAMHGQLAVQHLPAAQVPAPVPGALLRPPIG